jgi:hypothetical protein
MRALATTDAVGNRQYGDLPNTGLSVSNVHTRTKNQIWDSILDPKKTVTMTLGLAMQDLRYGRLAWHIERAGIARADESLVFSRDRSGKIRFATTSSIEYREKQGKIFQRPIK